jgi:hypothetical protein
MDTLLRLAAAGQVSLLTMLDCPDIAASMSPLYPQLQVAIDQKIRLRHSKAIREEVRLTLQGYLDASENLPTLRQLCARFGVTTGFVNYWFPKLLSAFSQKRRMLQAIKRQTQMTASVVALESGLLKEYSMGDIGRQRDIVRLASRSSGASIFLVREVLKRKLTNSGDKKK